MMRARPSSPARRRRAASRIRSLLADDKVEEAYGGVDYLPETFYVDRSGKVVLETAGITSEDGGKDEIEAHIKKLVAGGQ